MDKLALLIHGSAGEAAAVARIHQYLSAAQQAV